MSHIGKESRIIELIQAKTKMSKEDINKKIIANKKELFDLRMKQSTGNLEKPHKITTDRTHTWNKWRKNKPCRK